MHAPGCDGYIKPGPAFTQSGAKNTKQISDSLRSLARERLRGGKKKAPDEFEMITTLLETGRDADWVIVEGSFHGFKPDGESVVHKHQISI